MEILRPTPTQEEQKAAKRSLNFTLLTVTLICFTAIFCFSKMERTTEETEHIAELTIQKNRSETALLLARKGVVAPEYRPTIYSERSITLSTAYQPSISREVKVDVPVSVACNLSLSGGTSGQFNFQTSPDNSTWTTKVPFGCINTGSLTIGLNITNTNVGNLSWTVPKAYYYRVTTTTSSGSPTYTILSAAGETQL